MSRVARRQFSQRRRSSSSNSSAVVDAYSGNFRSTPLTQYPRCFKYSTKWLPMKPPAPVTKTFVNECIDSSLFDYCQNSVWNAAVTTRIQPPVAYVSRGIPRPDLVLTHTFGRYASRGDNGPGSHYNARTQYGARSDPAS